MLVSFTVKNFLSFKELNEFSFVSGSTRLKNERLYKTSKYSLLKFSAIFGANASGKSNLVKAMDIMRKLAIGGLPPQMLNIWYKLEPENINIPTYFEVKLNIQGHNYSYGFEYLAYENKYTSEWLYDLDKDIPLIERDILNATFDMNISLDGMLKTKMDVYRDDYKEDGNHLFIQFMNEKRNLIMNEELGVLIHIYDWFAYDLVIVTPKERLTSTTYYTEGKKLEEMSQLLREFDTGIDRISCVDADEIELYKSMPITVANKIREELKKISNERWHDFFVISDDLYLVCRDESGIYYKKVYFIHENTLFQFQDESDGTKRLLELLEILLTKKEGKTYFIDELDRCLHPNLSRKFVELYLENAKEKNMQLVVTTHENHLLDLKLLRRDEILFTEKVKGESKLYSLEQFQVRFDKSVDKAYLDGRYGAVPNFDFESFPL